MAVPETVGAAPGIVAVVGPETGAGPGPGIAAGAVAPGTDPVPGEAGGPADVLPDTAGGSRQEGPAAEPGRIISQSR